MRVFVTGGTGFIGSHFIRQAGEAGHEIVALRRSPLDTASGPAWLRCSGGVPAAGLSLESIPVPSWLRWVEAPLGSVPDEAFFGVEVLVHFAAAGVSPQVAGWQELFQVNVIESLALWMRAAAAGVKRFIICGSCFEFGATGERFDFIPPDAPLEPTNGYGASKAAATLAALGLAREQGLQMLLLRPFHFFGEGQNPGNFWPALRRAALAGEDFPMTLGEQIRDFSPVGQVAKLFVQSLNRPIQPGHPLVENIGSGQPQTLREFAEHWWSEWDAPGKLLLGAIPYRANDVMRYVPDIRGCHAH